MATKRIVQSVSDKLIRDKEELKKIIELKLEEGKQLSTIAITNQSEMDEGWKVFKDWNHFNEMLLKNSFERQDNIYFIEYKFKSPFYGFNYDPTFQQQVKDQIDAIKFAVTKLKRFYDGIDLLQYAESVQPKLESSKLDDLLRLLGKFHRVAQTLRIRYSDRETIEMNDEYDVQDLLNSLLHIYFDDIRPEEASPSHVGSNSRIDFVLRVEKIIIEVKITKDSLSHKKLGEELLVDIAKYKEYPNCDQFVIFIYDRIDKIPNKAGFKNDLEKQSTTKMKVHAVINPL
jgi:hypothetical protein